MNNFISLAQSLQPALFRIPLLGDTQCWDSYGRATTIAPLAKWRESAKGYWIGQNAPVTVVGGGISVSAGAETQATNGVLFFTAQSFQAVASDTNVRVIHMPAGGVDLIIGASCLYLGTDGVNYRQMTSASIIGAHTVAVRFNNGLSPQLFVDGAYKTTAVGTNVIAPVASAVVLTNAGLGATWGSQRNDYGAFIIFNDALLGRPISDQEIAQLHDAWESIISIKAPKRTISLPVQTSEVVSATPLLHLAGPRTPAGLWPDISGNGRDGTISGRVTQTKGPKGVVQQGHGTGNPLIITAADAALNPSSITAHLAFKRNGRGEANSGVYFAINNNLVMCMELWDLNATTLCIGETYADGEKYWTFPVPNVALKPTLDIVLRYNRDLPATLAYVLVDGEAVTVTDFNVKVGARVANPAPRVSVLGRGDLVLDADGAISDVQVYGSLLSDAECRALYVAQALLNEQRLANRTDYPISVAAVTAAGGVGPWNWARGTLNWSDDGTRRRIGGGAVNSVGTAPSSQAYGAWYWRHKSNGSPDSIFMPVASRVGGYNVAGQNGYAVDVGYIAPNLSLYLFRMTGGAAAALITSSAAGALTVGVEYEFFMTRRARDGLFSVWVRGGVYTTWTSMAVPAVDATYTTSVSQNVNVNNADYISDVTMLPDGSGLVPTDIPWLV